MEYGQTDKWTKKVTTNRLTYGQLMINKGAKTNEEKDGARIIKQPYGKVWTLPSLSLYTKINSKQIIDLT